MPLLLHDPAAFEIVAAAVLEMLVGEVGATYLGQARDGQAESLLLVRRRGAAVSQDPRTKWIVVLAPRAGVLPRRSRAGLHVRRDAAAHSGRGTRACASVRDGLEDNANSTARVLPYVW
jgi:hypothetical protein